jgi:hypothetical protein
MPLARASSAVSRPLSRKLWAASRKAGSSPRASASRAAGRSAVRAVGSKPARSTPFITVRIVPACWGWRAASRSRTRGETATTVLARSIWRRSR